jgi:hypothetical protein
MAQQQNATRVASCSDLLRTESQFQYVAQGALTVQLHFPAQPLRMLGRQPRASIHRSLLV